VYWTNYGGTVMKLSLGGGSPTTLASGQTSPEVFPCTIAVDTTSVYWNTCDNRAVMKLAK
jgi:hypothetical protein